MEIELTVNGELIRRDLPAKLPLMRFLREELRLTGTKCGCGTNDCGACTVLVDGEPTLSCLLSMRRVNGKHIETIEGLASGGHLHPVQAAFLETGAVQCGFCSPGMIMTVKALIDRNSSPTDQDIRTALKDNICRCTGYVKIIDAVNLAARWTRHPEEYANWHARTGGMGESAVDIDGEAKVTGTLPFADDLFRDKLLHGQLVWSKYPHAEVIKVDTGKAEQAPGVFRVLTAKDVPGLNAVGMLKADRPVFCSDRVRFTGDVLAMVLAESKDEAVAAAKLVEVEYNPLPGIFTAEDALKPDAPQIHPSGNIIKQLVHTVGDVDEGFKQVNLIIESRFETQAQEHAYLEPESGLGEVSADGVVSVYTCTQAPFEVRQQLMAVLSLPQDKVRVIATPLGGGFGGKVDTTVDPYVALGAFLTSRPVKLTLTREESLRQSTKRHPYVMDYKVGFDKDGTLRAVKARLVSDCGPYTAMTPRVIDQACIFSCGPYKVANVHLEGIAPFTNNANGSALRGFGINQPAVAIEQILDEAAEKLNLNPFEIRAKNMLVEGDATVSGEILRSSVGALPCLDAAKHAFEEEWPKYQKMSRPGYRMGFGIASGFKNVGAGKGKPDDAGAIYQLLPNGRVLVRASCIDMGQGIRTTVAQLASQSTGIGFRQFDILSGDTFLTIKHGAAAGERQTLICGNAVVIAGKKFSEKLLSTVSGWTGLPIQSLVLSGRAINDTEGKTVMSLQEAAERSAKEGVSIEAQETYIAAPTYALAGKDTLNIPPEQYRNYPAYAYNTQIAIIEVEEATGKVKVLHVIAAHDVGMAVNPQKIDGQVEGSCLMGQGWALTEDYPMKEGIPQVRTFGRLGIPRIDEAPTVRVEVVEDPVPDGPYGAKGVSEVATVPITPAILNAIYNATGVRTYVMPVNPAVVREALQKK